MLHRRIVTLAFLLFLVAPPALSGAQSPASVSTADSDGRQLRALMDTEAKLAALERAPAPNQETPTEAPKPVKRQRIRGKKQALAHTEQKVLGRRLTAAEVKGILSSSRDFSGTDLSGLNLAGTDFNGANLARTNLRGTNLERADLSEADLELADLAGANLSRASLHMARLRGTRIEGARFEGALWTDRSICRKGSVGKCVE